MVMCMFHTLFSRGADVNIQGRYKITPLMVAASAGYGDIVLLLLDKDADITCRNVEDRTALHLAAEGDALQALEVKTLLIPS